jgi:N-acetylglucosaminyl-diphospho-decaprenol L-rhamnosyltransferase
MDVSILIISFNTRALTLDSLASVVAQTRCVSYEVIVVDNASSDGSADAIAEQYPQVRLVRLQQNIGFARANNLAAKEAAGDFLLLLNPDTVVLDGAVQKALQFARGQSGEIVVGARTFFKDGSLNYNSCHGQPTPWSLLCQASGLTSIFRKSAIFAPESLGSWRRDTQREVDAVSGAFLLISRKLWNTLNGFDESFFMYGEDTDLCLRAWKAGAKCVLRPDVTLIHYGAASDRVRPDKMVRLFRAKVQLLLKHWRPSSVRFGVGMLKAAAFSRMLATGAVQWMEPARREQYLTWREIWRRRLEFDATGMTP